jgi:predicted GIY-YIG superfamily endonuclease
MNKMFFVYILYSKTINQTYVGFTTNLDKRLKNHKENPTRTTSRAADYKLIWYASFSSRELAELFEKYLKTHSGRAFMNKRLIGDLMKANNH